VPPLYYFLLMWLAHMVGRLVDDIPPDSVSNGRANKVERNDITPTHQWRKPKANRAM
jgi:hypothetical protein